MELVSGPAKSSKYRSRRIHDTQDQNNSEDDHLIFSADNHDELHRAWNHDLKNKEIAQIGVESIAHLLAATAAIPSNINGAPTSSPKVVFTDVDSFVSGLQLQNPLDQNQNYSNKLAPQLFVQESEPTVQDESSRGMVINGQDEETAPIREAAIGKGLSGALKLYRRTLGGEGEEDDVMDKKKRKLETTRRKSNKACHDYKEDGIRLEKTDEFGRTLSPKEAYKRFCHTFHGKKSGARKKENQMKKYQRELKLQEQMNTPSLFVERMKETQARHRTPYIILNDNNI